jgi:hypothetical protein
MPAKLGNSILVALVNAAPVSSTRAPSSEPRSLTTFDGFPLVPVGSISAREIKARHTFIKANQVCVLANKHLVGKCGISAIEALTAGCRSNGNTYYEEGHEPHDAIPLLGLSLGARAGLEMEVNADLPTSLSQYAVFPLRRMNKAFPR